MDKREKEILKQIQEKMGHDNKEIPVPDRLKPDNIEQMLKEREAGQAKKDSGKIRTFRRIGKLAAACLVLAVGIPVITSMIHGGAGSSGTSDIQVLEDAGEIESGAGDSEGIGSGGLKTAASYDEIYDYLEEQQETAADTGGKIRLFGAQKEMAVDEAPAADIAMEESMESATAAGGEAYDDAAGETTVLNEEGHGGYSETNVRQEGVDEADIVKTDGQFLYVLKDNNQEIAVVRAGESMEPAGRILADDLEYIREFYVIPSEKKLVYAAEFYDDEEPYNMNKVRVVTYDISDPGQIRKLGSVSQTGSYSSSRFSKGYLYLFSDHYVSYERDRNYPVTYIPMVNDTLIKEEDIYLPPFEHGCRYEVITAVDLDAPSEAADSKAIFTDGGEMYVSRKNIYYYETKWNEKAEKQQTVIRKIGYENGNLTPKAKGTIDGYIHDSFAIDEYAGYLRIAATVGETNSVYVLDDKLDIAGSIEGLAKDERIYSARFMGETGYFVTYRETDPLFSVDLSNPKKPKIMGKLKIPGFSNYLHFYGEGKLLGIGMSMDEETQMTEGVKLSMFDISDPVNVKEESTYVIENTYDTDVTYDYKAALVSVDTNRIGFGAYQQGSEMYYLFHYDQEEGFVCDLSEELNGNSSRAARGLYIGKLLYVVQGNVIETYSLEDFRKVDDLIL